MSRTWIWLDHEREREVTIDSLGSGQFRISVDGVEMTVAARSIGPDRIELKSAETTRVAEITVVGERRFVRLGSLDFVLEREARGRRRGVSRQSGGLVAPMPGVVARVMVKTGDRVERGQPLLAIEAMKMEHLIRAPHPGRIRSITVAPGELVNGGIPLVEMEPEE